MNVEELTDEQRCVAKQIAEGKYMEWEQGRLADCANTMANPNANQEADDISVHSVHVVMSPHSLH